MMRQLTLAVGSHVLLHGSILHHSSRASSHHLRVRARSKGSLGSHAGELLLLVVHDLLSGLASRLLLLRVVVEGGRSIIAKAIVGRVHGLVWGGRPLARAADALRSGSLGLSR